MGEDADKDAVPRKSRVFNRVLDVLVMSFTMKALMYMTKCPSSCNWNKELADIKEHQVRLVSYIKRRTCGITSARLQLFSI